MLVANDDGTFTEEEVYLMADSNDPSQCYRRWPKRPIPLNGRGKVLFCQVLLRDRRQGDDRILFRHSPTTVAIKKLRREVIDQDLQRQAEGGNVLSENPYNEIYIMRQYGDHVHVMGCYEELWDTRYIYIVMVYVREGDLHSHVAHRPGGGYIPREQVPAVVKMLVKNLQYLHERNLVHRDLKPENVFQRLPWFPFGDLAMTLQAAVLEGTPQNILNTGPAGSPSYISPEVFFQRPFNYKVDVWALGCIVWNLLTGLRLYDIPSDVSFSFFIRAGGIADEGLADRVLEVLMADNVMNDLTQRIKAVQVLSPVARVLLKRLLQENPENRPTLHEILQHPFFDGV